MSIEARQRVKYLISDIVSTELAVLLFNMFRYTFMGSIDHETVSLGVYLCYPMIMLGQITVPIMMVGLYYLSGVYNLPFVRSRMDEFITTFKTALAGTLIVFFAQLINDLSTDRAHDYLLFLVLLGLLFILVYIPRAIITTNALKRIRHHHISFPTIIVGYEPMENMEEKLHSLQQSMGLRIVGYVDGSGTGNFSMANKPAISLEDLPEQCRKLEVKNIIVIQHPQGFEATLPIIYNLLVIDAPVYLWPNSLDLMASRSKLSDITSEPLIEITGSQISQSMLNIKRLSDIMVSLLAISVLALPMAIIAIAVKCDSPGTALYRQERVGYRRKPFNILKFRTMKSDAEASDKPQLSSAADSRVTALGHILRKYRLDELPQFFNVLKGDMSIVGPRPEREYFIKQIVEKAPFYVLLHQVRPGITSWGMVKYGYASSVDEMIERMKYDLLYIENISFAVDMKILLRTAATVIYGKGV